MLRGRRFLVPQDVYDVAPEVLRHRLLLTYDGLAAGLQVDAIVARVLATIQAPRVAPHQDERTMNRVEGAAPPPPAAPYGATWPMAAGSAPAGVPPVATAAATAPDPAGPNGDPRILTPLEPSPYEATS
jgi:AAA lid domain-containing protein